MFIEDKDDSRKKLFGVIYWRDIILLSIILLLALGIHFVIKASGGESSYAVVKSEGTEIYRLPLGVDTTISFASGDYTYTLSVKRQRVAITEADCPDEICVNTGYISSNGEVIACVPGGLTVTIEGSEGSVSSTDAETY